MSGQGAAVPSVSGGGDGGAGVATLVPRRVVGDPTAELALRSPQASGGVAGAREASEVGKPPVGAAGGWGRCRCARGGAPGWPAACPERAPRPAWARRRAPRCCAGPGGASAPRCRWPLARGPEGRGPRAPEQGFGAPPGGGARRPSPLRGRLAAWPAPRQLGCLDGAAPAIARQQRSSSSSAAVPCEATRVSLFGFLRQRAPSCPLLLQEIVNCQCVNAVERHANYYIGCASGCTHQATKHQATKPLRWHTFFER